MKLQIKVISIIVFFISLVIFSGCEKDGAFSPISQERTSSDMFVQTNIGPIKILRVDAKKMAIESSYSLEKNGAEDSVFYAEKLIKKQWGGRLRVGDRERGFSKIRFKRNALPMDALIQFQWVASSTLEGMLNSLEFGPHGLNFNKAVNIELSYKMADLSDVNEDDLKLFYYNEDSGLWELIGGEVKKNRKVIKAKIWHFSRYAIGAE